MMNNCAHVNFIVEFITADKVHGCCPDCNNSIVASIEQFDLHSLLHKFSKDVCSGCEQIPSCWDSEHMVMPEPNYMRHYCKKGAHFCFGDFDLNIVQKAAITEIERRNNL